MTKHMQVEKEVYEAVLRNSIRVNDLEVENQQLKELLKLCKESIENYRSGKNHNFTADNIVRLIDNAIGEKKW